MTHINNATQPVTESFRWQPQHTGEVKPVDTYTQERIDPPNAESTIAIPRKLAPWGATILKNNEEEKVMSRL